MSPQPVTSYRTNIMLSAVLKHLFAVIIALIILIPLATAVMGGFKSNADLQTNAFGWPAQFVSSNYGTILASSSFWQQLLNSTLVMLGTTVGVVVLAAMPAFIFARVE